MPLNIGPSEVTMEPRHPPDVRDLCDIEIVAFMAILRPQVASNSTTQVVARVTQNGPDSPICRLKGNGLKFKPILVD